MDRALDNRIREYRSGERVQPGIYIDVETGAIVEMREQDELPARVRIVESTRRFRLLDARCRGERVD